MALLSADNPEEISFSWTGTTKGGGGGWASLACWGVGGRTATAALIYIPIQPRWNIESVASATFLPSIITYIRDEDLIVLFILLTNQRKSSERKRSRFGFNKQNLQLWIYQRRGNVFTPFWAR